MARAVVAVALAAAGIAAGLAVSHRGPGTHEVSSAASLARIEVTPWRLSAKRTALCLRKNGWFVLAATASHVSASKGDTNWSIELHGNGSYVDWTGYRAPTKRETETVDDCIS